MRLIVTASRNPRVANLSVLVVFQAYGNVWTHAKLANATRDRFANMTLNPGESMTSIYSPNWEVMSMISWSRASGLRWFDMKVSPSLQTAAIDRKK